MGKKTKIDWCDSTWNPVTGCLYGCEYCYARRIAKRFGGYPSDERLHELDVPQMVSHRNDDGEWNPWYKCAYPFSFSPTFHHYKLDEPQKWKKPRNIFVCSMADLFGEWVPNDWIETVINACLAAPQHRYLFLTKNPARYIELAEKNNLPDADNMWYGSTTTTPETDFFFSRGHNTFLSIEPILKTFSDSLGGVVQACEKTDWIILGAETGSRNDKVTPKASWIMDIVQIAETTNTPVFMKESLRGLMGDDFIQEYPWEV